MIESVVVVMFIGFVVLIVIVYMICKDFLFFGGLLCWGMGFVFVVIVVGVFFGF